jgi:hypothetical protein
MARNQYREETRHRPQFNEAIVRTMQSGTHVASKNSPFRIDLVILVNVINKLENANIVIMTLPYGAAFQQMQ